MVQFNYLIFQIDHNYVYYVCITVTTVVVQFDNICVCFVLTECDWWPF
jgi:hypothetical protein